MIPLAVGRKYRLSFYCRCEEGAEFHAIFQKNGAPYSRLGYREVKAAKAWQRVEIIGEPREAYQPNGTVLTCHLGERKQTVQIADVRIEELP